MTSRGERFEVVREVQARRFNEELVILHLGRGEYFSIDEVGSRVWESLSRGESLTHIVHLLAADYDADVARIDSDVRSLVAELVDRQLLVEVSAVK